MNATFDFDWHVSYGCASQLEMGHSRTRTFFRGLIPVGGSSVN
jgi:hypothetical protein